MGNDITDVRPKPLDIIRQLPNLYMKADEADMTLSHYLERRVDNSHDPRAQYNAEERSLRSFGRLMLASGVQWKSDPGEGYWATAFEDVAKDPNLRYLIPEWGAAIWRKTRFGGGYAPQASTPDARFVITAGDDTLNSALRPIVDASGIYQQELTPAVGLSDIVGFTTPITGDTYRRTYMTDPSASDTRMVRIGETSDIPRATIRTSDRTINLFKYGRGIEMSYEALRRTPIDKIGFFVAKAALQVEADRFAQAVDVALNGDGNSGTGATGFTQGGLDTGTTLTVKALMAFKSKFLPPYRLTHIFGREAELVNLQMLQMPNDNPFLTQVQGVLGMGSLQALQDLNGGVVFYGQTNAVAAGTYLGIDRRFLLERVTEIGSDISETQRYIDRQTEALFFTETDGFAVVDANANKTLTMS